MTGRAGRKFAARCGAVILVATLMTTAGANAATHRTETPSSQEGAPAIRLEVPTSIAFDPLAEIPGGGAPAVELGPAVAPWTDLPDYPTATFDSRIGVGYVMGGNDGTRVSNRMFRYREDTAAWYDELLHTARPRQAPAVATTVGQSEMVMAGGWDENGEPSATTHYYDDASTEWVYEWNEMPSARAAAGYASFGRGNLYVIGGCTTKTCNPVSDSVFSLRWWGEWSEMADYPVPVAFPACGSWKERIYCTGGHDGTEGISDSYVYDRRVNTWSPLPDPPTDSWGAQHAMINGILMVNGGVQGGAVTNNTFGYDVKTGVWIDLPNSNTARYRGAGGCLRDGSGGRRFMSVGGLNGSDVPLAEAEVLPGVRACGDEFDAPVVSRYAGSNRYGTAAAIAGLYQDPVDTVFVTTGENFPDALAGAARAGILEAPILLTRSNSLPEATRAELERASPQNIILIGGQDAVTDDVMGLIGDASGAESVRRLAGTNRYDTAAAVAGEIESADTVFVATGTNFPDALAGASRAAALDAPLLLAQRNRLPASTVAQLERLSPENIVVLGGAASVSDSVVTQLGAYGTVERIAGSNRWETAALVAAQFQGADFPDAQMVGVASGRTWSDALTGSAHAGGVGIPLLLADTDRIPARSRTELERLGPDAIQVYGGSAAITGGVFDQLKALYD